MKLQTLKPRIQTMRAPTAVDVVINPSSWRTSDQTSAQRGYGYKWQQARAGYLVKHPLCVFCLRKMGIEYTNKDAAIIACLALGNDLPWANTVDHSVPHCGDMTIFWRSELWQSLCAPCHSGEAQKRDRASI